MSAPFRWSYAINQWKSSPITFVRHEHHARALKTCSVLGFDVIELQAGTGRWDNMGRPEHIALGHGSIRGFQDFLAGCGIRAVSSMTWDPTAPAEEEGGVPRSTSNRADHPAIIKAASHFLDFLADIGAETFVVRASESAWMLPGGLDLPAVAELHNALGAIAHERGVRVALNIDCLSSFRPRARLDALLDATDPALVGLSVDTAEFAVAGHDPIDTIRRHRDRIVHVQLKDTRFVDDADAYLLPNAETALLQGGGGPQIDRWFYELGTPGGLVDVRGVLTALRDVDYQGWVVVESDQSPVPAESAMLNAWYLRRLPEAGFEGARA